MTYRRKTSLTETNSRENDSTNDDLGSIPERQWRRMSLAINPWVRFSN